MILNSGPIIGPVTKTQPKVGERIVAERRVRSKIYANMIIGPVTDVCENACRVTTNAGSDIESNWQINYSDWTIRAVTP